MYLSLVGSLICRWTEGLLPEPFRVKVTLSAFLDISFALEVLGLVIFLLISFEGVSFVISKKRFLVFALKKYWALQDSRVASASLSGILCFSHQVVNLTVSKPRWAVWIS